MTRKILATLLLAATACSLFAQRGYMGPKTVSAANTIVNEYTNVTANIFAGNTTITVANSSLNANGRFAGNLQPGDMVMIYQPVGAIMNVPGIGSDTSWGRIDAGNYFACGHYEFHEVRSVPNGTSITLDCGTTYDYFVIGGTARKAEVIRVPRYTTLTINGGGVLTCDPWNGTIGGVVIAEVQGNTVINAGGIIDVTGRGFRGGNLGNDNATTFGSNTAFTNDSTLGAAKGEGVCGYGSEYTVFGGRYGRGAGGNAGGGGSSHNAGGGGGANAPNSTSATSLWSGNGIPDLSGVNWTTAWNLEPPINTMSLRTAVNSAGGGRGGYSFSGNNQNAITTPPGNAAWGGDARNYQATGLGGRALDYSTGRLFFGGGGGAGDQNNLAGGNGGNGGGLIYLMCFGNISGSGTVNANGNNGFNAQGGSNAAGGIDGAGGAGGGGTAIMNAVTGVANTLTINTNGGTGGSQVIGFPFTTNEAEGPGGGGGGGYIAVSSGAPTRNSNGGNGGTTNSQALTEFTVNGGTKGCPGTNNASITNFTININDTSICANTSVTLTALLGGTPPPGVTIEWWNALTGGNVIATGSTFTSPVLSSTTTYYVGTCPGWWRVPVTVTVNPAPTPSASASPNTVCVGQSSTLTASGGTTYTWNGGSLVNATGASQSVTPGSTTTYTVTVSNGGCSATTQVTVTVLPTPTPTASAAPSSICVGQTSTLTATGGGTYTWNGGSLVNATGASQTVSPGSTTTYTVSVSNGTCSATAQVTVTVLPAPSPTVSATPATICVGQTSTLTASGGTSYTWNGGSLVNATGASQTVTPGSTTTYTVTVSNGSCSTNAQVTVTVNPVPVPSASAAPQTICAGQTSTLTASGGTSYTWNGGSLVNATGASQSVTPGSTTTYTVTVSNGTCSATAQVTITVNPLPTPTASAAPSSICAGQTTTLTASGGGTYTWNGGSLVNASGASQTVSPASTTTYTVTVTSGAGCSATAQTTVTVNPLPTPMASAAPSTICDGQPSTLTATGGGTYTWNGGSLVNANGASQNVTPNSTTTYTVTVTSGAGCSATAQTTVTVNPLPNANAGIDQTICSGATATLTATGGGTYTWNGGSLVNAVGASQSVTPAGTTTYVVTVTSGSGCSKNDTVVVNVNPSPVTSAGSDVTICSGDTTQLGATGAGTFNWSPSTGLSNANISNPLSFPSSTTTYTVTLTGANGCTGKDSITVTVNPRPNALASNDTTICNGSSITIAASGGGTYTWNGGSLVNANGASQNVNPSSNTSYTVTVTAANGCTDKDTVNVAVNALPVINAGPDVNICPSSSIQLNATGGITYSWSPSTGLSNPNISNPVATPAVTTTYVVTGTNANGCSSTDTVIVNLTNSLSVNAGPDQTICAGDTVQLSTSGGVTYLWSPSATLSSPNSATTNAFPASTTSYVVQVTDANSCSGTDTVTVFVNGPVILTTTGAGTICVGQSATISATPTGGNSPYTYSWSNSLSGAGPFTVSPTTTTTYTVQVTDSTGCSSVVQSITVNVNPPLVLSSLSNSSVCAGTPVTLTVNASGGDGNYTYTWTPIAQTGSSVTFTPGATTTVTVIVTDGCGSTADTSTATITVNPVPVVSISSTGTSGCAPLCVDFTGNSTGNCSVTAWDFGDSNTSSSQNPIHCYTTAGTYNVSFTCTDANGCSGTVTNPNMITVNPSPVASFNSSVPSGVLVLQPGGQQQVCYTDNSTGATTWYWQFGADTSTLQSPCFTVTDTGSYCATLVVTAPGGCADTSEQCFDVFTNATFVVPNVFTPNADGTNDIFFVSGTGMKSLHAEIYDRWGVKIYEWSTVNGGWDGHTSSGNMATDGVYYYIINITDYSDKLYPVKGFVHLMRGKP